MTFPSQNVSLSDDPDDWVGKGDDADTRAFAGGSSCANPVDAADA